MSTEHWKHFQFRYADHTLVSVLAVVCCNFIVVAGSKTAYLVLQAGLGGGYYQICGIETAKSDVFEVLRLKGSYYAHWDRGALLLSAFVQLLSSATIETSYFIFTFKEFLPLKRLSD